jgi:hypothetical protein
LDLYSSEKFYFPIYVRDSGMQMKANFFKNIILTTLLASMVILLGCQKQNDLSEQDAAMANADRSAQAAQAATDAATAAVPSENTVIISSTVTETSKPQSAENKAAS